MKNKIQEKIKNTKYQKAIDALQCTAWGLGSLFNIAATVYSIYAFKSIDWFSLIIAIIFALLIPLSIGDGGIQMRTMGFSAGVWIFPFIFSIIYSFVYSLYFITAAAVTAIIFTFLLIYVFKIKKDTKQ